MTRPLTADEERRLRRLAARVARARANADAVYAEQVQEWDRLFKDGVGRPAIAKTSGLKNPMSVKFAQARIEHAP